MKRGFLDADFGEAPYNYNIYVMHAHTPTSIFVAHIALVILAQCIASVVFILFTVHIASVVFILFVVHVVPIASVVFILYPIP